MTTFSGHLTEAQAQRLLDGVLLPAEATEAEAHAAECAECQALIASFAALSDALGGLAVPDLPADFTAGVLDEIDARERAVVRERRLAWTLCLAGVLAIAGVAAWLLGTSGWGPVVNGLAERMGAAGRALRLAAGVLPPVVATARLPLAVALAALVAPLLLLLSRLMTPSPRTELA